MYLQKRVGAKTTIKARHVRICTCAEVIMAFLFLDVANLLTFTRKAGICLGDNT